MKFTDSHDFFTQFNRMGKILVYITCFLSLNANGQTTTDCKSIMKKADAAINNSDYSTALSKLRAFKVCSPNSSKEADDKILKVFKLIEGERDSAYIAKKEAVEQTAVATHENKIAQSRYYSIVAQRLQQDNPELAELISVEAYKIYPTDEAYAMLLNIAKVRPQLQAMLHEHSDEVTSVIFNDSDNVLISAGKDGYLKFWNTEQAKEARKSLPVFTKSKFGIENMTFCDSRQLIAVCGIDSNYNSCVKLIDYKNHIIWKKNFSPATINSLSLNLPSTLLFSKNGETLFIGSSDGKIYLWNISDQHRAFEDSIQVVPKEYKHSLFSKGVASLCLTLDNKILISGDELGFVKEWDLATRKEIVYPQKKHDGLIADGEVINSDVSGLGIDRNGTIIASGGSDGKIKLWNIKTGALLDSLFIPGLEKYGMSNIQNIKIPEDSDSLLAAIYSNGNFIVWDWKNKMPIFTNFGIDWLPNSKYSSKIAYSKNLGVLAASRSNGQISIWNIANGQQTGTPLQGHIGEVKKINFFHQGRYMISSGEDGTVRLWDLLKREQLASPIITGKAPILIAEDAFSTQYGYDPVSDVAIDERRGILYFAPNLFEGLIIYDLKKYKIIDTIRFNTTLSQLLFNDKKDIFATVTKNGNELRLYQKGINNKYSKVPVESDEIKKIDFKPNSNDLFLLTDNGLLYKYSMDKNKLTIVAGDSSFHISDFFLNRSGSLMAVVIVEDFDIYMFETMNFKQLAVTLTGHSDEVSAIDFHPFKNILVSSGTDGTIRLWSLETFLELGLSFTGHETSEQPSLYSHDQNGEIQGINYVNTTTIPSLKFSEDGKFLVSGASDGTIRYWTIDPDELVRNSRRRAGRELSNIEKRKYFGVKRSFLRLITDEN